MPTPTRLNASRLPGLDGLRGVAVLSVALFHYTALYPSGHTGALIATLPFGFLGVDLFFILSGFVILMTTERSAGLMAFARARTLRLWPVFIACCLFTGGVIWLADGHGPNLTRLLGNLTMMPLLFQQEPIDGSYWSLGCEVVFYGLIALALLKAGLKAERFCLIWLAVSAVCLAFENRIPGKVLFLTEPHFAPLFALGMMTNRWYERRAGLESACVAALALLSMAIPAPHWGAMLPISGAAYALIAAALAVLVGSAARMPGGPWSWPLLRWCGRISYPLYLLHQMAGYRLIGLLEHAGVNANVAVATTLAAGMAVSELMVRLVETPARQQGQRRHHGASALRTIS